MTTASPDAVRGIVENAIAHRCGYNDHTTLLGLSPDPEVSGAVLVHVNSGGNSLAVEQALGFAGYDVEAPAAGVPCGFGVMIRVRRRAPRPPAPSDPRSRADRRGHTVHPRHVGVGQSVREKRDAR